MFFDQAEIPQGDCMTTKMVSKSIALTQGQVELVNDLVEGLAALGMKCSFSSIAQKFFKVGLECFDLDALRDNPVGLYYSNTNLKEVK